MYAIQSQHVLSVLRDQPTTWEDFSDNRVPIYLRHGLALMRARLNRLGDMNRRFSQEDVHTVQFMLDSLIQARQLLDELEA